MTEIKIEKKTPFWPWLLLLLGIVAAVWFFFFRNDEVEALETIESTELVNTEENNSSVASYITFINSDLNSMGIDHEFTSEALTKLTDAVDAKATEIDFDVQTDIAIAKQLAEEITKDPMAINHSNKIRSAADALSTSLQNMQQAKYPALSAEATDLKNAASAIEPEKLTLEQREAVKSFFRKAADLLSKMD
jgi:hypothetical protein